MTDQVTCILPRWELPTEVGTLVDGDESQVTAADAREEPRLSLPVHRLHDVGLLGRGGFANVHASHDSVLLRTVAKKTLEQPRRMPVASTLRFIEEAQITAQLEHPNIVPVYDFALDELGRQYYTMKLVKGRTFSQVLRDIGPTPDSRSLGEILRIFLKVCDALSFAHSRGVVHRDLKPDNIMVGGHGQVYVMDWGIAHLMHGERPSQQDGEGAQPIRLEGESMPRTQNPNVIVGSFAYMPPEQANGRFELIDGRTDVFALGAILYQAITGRPPYVGEDFARVLMAARRGVIEAPDAVAPGHGMPAALVRIAMKALSCERDERHASVEALRDDVEAFLRGGLCFVTRQYAAGTVLFEEGSVAAEAFVITAGECEVFKRGAHGDLVLRRLTAGGVFGEAAILPGQVRTASVRALTDVTLTVITQESLQAELVNDNWTTMLVRALAGKFLELEANMTSARAALQEHEVVETALAFLCRRGTRGPQGMEGDWSACVAILRERFKLAPAELLRIVAAGDGLTVDTPLNRIILRDD